MTIGAMVLLAAGAAAEGWPALSGPAVAIIAWLAIINTAVAFTVWNFSLRHLTAGESSVVNNTTNVEVYGRKKRGVAYNHQSQRVGRQHVAAWAETEIVLAADLGDGTDDSRATAPDLLHRALACLPAAARASGRVAMRAECGYFAGQLARVAHDAGIAFAIGARRITPLWRLLADIAEDAWDRARFAQGRRARF